ncbi:MAG: hypothetical protein QM765_43115 [Myxococcales bacterium]
MSPLRLPLERLVPAEVDLPVLEERARRLCADVACAADPRPVLLVVRFYLAGERWAVTVGGLQRALVAVGAVHAIPSASGPARAVAFVDEEPVPVFDLCGAVGPSREPRSLALAPALVLRDGVGPLAVAVEGPLDLDEAVLLQKASSPALRASALPLAGRLEGGAGLLDLDVLRERASRALRAS